ncbi:MAG: exo-alpha-sialidase [Chloroflexi bacterium]|nr:exo-alpha-sialidase [Chloroflexota bacterium]
MLSPLSRAGRNVNVSNQSGSQSETSIAVDPTNPFHLLASNNDLSLGSSTKLLKESTDGGKTWVVVTTGITSFCYDTWLAFNSAGDAFMAYECSDQRYAYRKVGQTTWTLTKFTIAGGFPDRDMMTIDRSASSAFKNTAYIGYDDNGANNTAYLLYSRDGFTGWVRSPKINDTSTTIGVNAATAPDGTVYATWEDYSGKKIWVDRSTNGGASWGTDHVAHTFRINTSGFFIFIPPQNSRGVLPMPMTAVAPAGTANAGRLYVSYFDIGTSGSNTNIYVVYSDDGGTTWSAEAKINDDTVSAYHFHQAISVSPNGTVGVSFYDTRSDPGVNKKTDRYVAFSTDGGATWGANLLVTTATSNETVGCDLGNQYGDYQGMDTSAVGRFHLSWTDARVPGATCEDLFSAFAMPAEFTHNTRRAAGVVFFMPRFAA